MSEGVAAGAAQRKRGNALGFWFFKTAIRLFGLRGAYGLLYPVCMYYLLFDRQAVTSSMAYVRRRFKGSGPLGRLMHVYRIFLNQGMNLIDRHYMIRAGGGFDIDLRGYDKISRLLDGSRGLVLLTAHVGNWQVSMSALKGFQRTVHLLMRPEENAAVREALDVYGDGGMVKVISSEGFMGGAVESASALNSGDLVSIMGDRGYGADTVEADLFGGRVRFPYGAFVIAASCGCPVVVLLSARRPDGGYEVDVSNVIEPPETSRKRRKQNMGAAVREFARILEGYAMAHPYQWFVFEDIWLPEAAGADSG